MSCNCFYYTALPLHITFVQKKENHFDVIFHIYIYYMDMHILILWARMWGCVFVWVYFYYYINHTILWTVNSWELHLDVVPLGQTCVHITYYIIFIFACDAQTMAIENWENHIELEVVIMDFNRNRIRKSQQHKINSSQVWSSKEQEQN